MLKNTIGVKCRDCPLGFTDSYKYAYIKLVKTVIPGKKASFDCFELYLKSSKIVCAQLQTEKKKLDSLELTELNTLKWSVGAGNEIEIYFRELPRLNAL